MANVSIYDLSFKGKEKQTGWFGGETIAEIDSGLQITSKQVLPNEQIYKAVKKVPSDKTLPDDFVVQVFFTFDEQSFIRNKNAVRMMKKISDNMAPNGFYSMPSLPFVYSFYPNDRQVNQRTNTTYAIMKPIPMWRHILDTSTRKFHWFMFNALSTLFYLHKLGIIHRNISPDSVYFVTDSNDNPSIFIHNFASACWMNDQTDLTQIVKCNETAPLLDYIDPVLLPKSRVQLQKLQQQAASNLSEARKKELIGQIDQAQAEFNKKKNDFNAAGKGNQIQNDPSMKVLREKIGRLRGELGGAPPRDVRDNQATYAPFTDKSDVYAMGMLFYQIVTQGIGYENQNRDPWDEALASNIDFPQNQDKIYASRKLRLSRSNLDARLQNLILKMIHPNPAQRCDAEEGLLQLIVSAPGAIEEKVAQFRISNMEGEPQRAIMRFLGSQSHPEIPNSNEGTLAKRMQLKWSDIDQQIQNSEEAANKYGSIRERKFSPEQQGSSWGQGFYKAGLAAAPLAVPAAVAVFNPFAAGAMVAGAGLIKVHDRFQQKLSQRWRKG